MSEDLESLKHGKTDVHVEEVILRRWSPRAYSNKAVSDADLRSIFTAGAWAASSYNEQPWRFLVGKKDDATWAGILDALMPMNQAWAKAATVLYASFAKTTFSHNNAPNGVAPHDVGAASAQISLQATALGMHTHGMGGFDAAKLRANFNVPDGFNPVACWALGYLGDPESLDENFRKSELQPRTRKPLSEFVFKGWDKPAF